MAMAALFKRSIARSRHHGACVVGSAMRAAAGTMAALVALGLLSGCATALLGREDRAQVCRVAVVVPSDPYVPRENVLANPAGGVTGTGLGALALVAAYANPFMIFVAPMVVGHGMQCAAGSMSHPNAHADFQAIYRAAGAQALALGMERELEAVRGSCMPTESARVPKPDTVVEVASIGVMPGCAYGDWMYAVSVTWRVKRADSGGILAETMTECSHATNRDVDDWFAHSKEGRVEFEQVLRAIGKRMADELTADHKLERCSSRTLKGGEIGLD
jgi:hypothetical protein